MGAAGAEQRRSRRLVSHLWADRGGTVGDLGALPDDLHGYRTSSGATRMTTLPTFCPDSTYR